MQVATTAAKHRSSIIKQQHHQAAASSSGSCAPQIHLINPFGHRFLLQHLDALLQSNHPDNTRHKTVTHFQRSLKSVWEGGLRPELYLRKQAL
jgi:hypothetical protein